MTDPATWPDLDLEQLRAEAAARAEAWRRIDVAETVIQEAVAREVPGAGPGVDALLRQAEARSIVVPLPPATASRPHVALAKKAVYRAVSGPLHHLASQVGSLGGSLVAALRGLERRVTHLEASEVASDVRPSLPGLDEAAARTCAALLAGCAEPVLHTEAATGELVIVLGQAGQAAYGVERSAERVLAARAAGADVRLADPLAHACALGPGAAGAVVLSGWVVLSGPGRSARLLTNLASTGVETVVVVTPGRASFAADHPVAADLAESPPLHGETWVALLDAAGFDADPPVASGSHQLVRGRRRRGVPERS